MILINNLRGQKHRNLLNVAKIEAIEQQSVEDYKDKKRGKY